MTALGNISNPNVFVIVEQVVRHIVEYIRVSAGTAAVLGLKVVKNDTPPTTAYLMVDHRGKCSANCSFCPQSRSTKGKDAQLSRITWPRYSLTEVSSKLEQAVESHKLFRACIQTLNYPTLLDDLLELMNHLQKIKKLPISIAVHPLPPDGFGRLKAAGVDRVGIALDGCTRPIFERIKGENVQGPYRWDKTLASLQEAINVFGKGKVATHFIVGLGETEQELFQAVQDVKDLGVSPSLFAFTPIKGTKEDARAQPPILRYRKMQLGRELIINRGYKIASFSFSREGELQSFHLPKNEYQEIMHDGSAFQTRGCPQCNRPYYDSHPGGTIYNYATPLSDQQKAEIERLLQSYL